MQIRMSSFPPLNQSSAAPTRKRRVILALALVALAILGSVAPTLAASATLLREPYVQQVYTNSLIVAWTTEESGSSEVRFGESDFGTTAAATSTHFSTGESAPYDSYYLHQATLTGLSANTVYQYKIYTNGIDITPGGSIDVRTAKSTSATSFRFAALGDSGTGNQNQIDVAERLLQVQPDFAVHTGDIIYNTSTYTHFEERFFQIYDEFIRSNWFAPSPGNHDTDYNSGQSYVDVFINPENGASDPIEREMYYSFDYANAHFSVVTPEISYSSGSDQYQWLENDLANTSKFWKFVVFHTPPYYTSDKQEFRKKGDVDSVLVPLFEQYDVDIVLSGDVHLYERFKPLKNEQLATIEEGGIVYVTTGGGGVGLNQSGSFPWHEFVGEKARLFHLTMFDVDNCKVELSAVEKTSGGDSFDNSDIFDSYTLDRCEGPPVADFSASTTSGNTPLTVNFSDLSSKSPSSWSWTFGDGGTSTAQNPSHTYNAAGTYTVSLTATNNDGSDTETKTGYITVTDPPAPTADFSATPTSGDTPLTVDFTDLSTDGPTSWSWDFGDTNSSTAQNPSHTYNAEGTYTVTLTASNANGSDQEIKVGYIVVTDPPAPFADFSGNPTSGNTPLTVDFSDLSTNNPTSWSWTFGDGGTSSAQNPSHTYNAAGTYTVSLTASHAYGSDGETKTDYIVVTDLPAPVADFSGNSTSGNTPLTVDFSDLSTNNPTSWSWTFGDGGTSSAQNPTHTYDTAGTYTVSLTASHAYGSDSETKTDYIVVTDPPAPVADFAASSTSGNTPFTVDFSDLSTNNPTSWSWTFGDGGTSTAQNPSHTYNAAGTYTVSLTASHAYGSDGETKVGFIVVTDPPAPVANFSASPTSGATPLTVDFTDLSTNNPTSWSWSFGDGGTSTAQNPSHTFNGIGTYTISLTASHAYGSDVETKTEYITVTYPPPPEVRFKKAAYDVNEADGSIVVTVELAYGYHEEITVAYYTSDGTAAAISDYTSTSNTLTFTPGGSTSKTIAIPIVNNNTDEEDEDFTVTLTNPTVASLGTPSVTTITIKDDDPPPVITFTKAISSVNESAFNSMITASLSAVSNKTVTVNYAGKDGTATSGADFTAVSNSLTFLPGETMKTFAVPILEDVLDEEDESFTVELKNAQNGTPGDPITINIIDNDDPPLINFLPFSYNVNENGAEVTLTVRLSAVSAKTVTAAYAVTGGTAVSGSDFTLPAGTVTISPGELTDTINVTILDDDIEDGSKSIMISLNNAQNSVAGNDSTATVTILDDEGPPLFQFSSPTFSATEGDEFGYMTVILAGSSVNNITVAYNINAETAVYGDDYVTTNGTLTFTPGTSSQDIKIPLVDNNVSEGDETLSVTLSNVSNGIPGSPITAQLVISDDDPFPVVNLSGVPQSINENAGEITLTAQLDTVSEQIIQVEYVTGTQPAKFDNGNQIPSGTITFAPGELSQTFTVPITNDELDAPDEILTINLVNPTNAEVGTEGSAEITVEDDDPPVSIAFAMSNYSVNEGAGSAEIEVALGSASGHVVTVNVATADLTALAGSDYAAINNVLTFAAGETSRTVTVQILNDDLSEGSEELSLTLSSANHAQLITPDVAVLTIVDNDGSSLFLPIVSSPQ